MPLTRGDGAQGGRAVGYCVGARRAAWVRTASPSAVLIGARQGLYGSSIPATGQEAPSSTG